MTSFRQKLSTFFISEISILPASGIHFFLIIVNESPKKEKKRRVEKSQKKENRFFFFFFTYMKKIYK